MENKILSEEMKEELSAMLRGFLDNPPYLSNQDQLKKLAKMLEGDVVGNMAARLIADVVNDWIKIVGKVLMAYALLGISAQEKKDRSGFIKKLMEGL